MGMMRKGASALLAVSSIGVVAGCASIQALPAPGPELSTTCTYSVILEWGQTNFRTPEDAVSAMVASYQAELENASSVQGLEPNADDSPVRLNTIVRGLTAALEQVGAEEGTDPEARSQVVVGMWEDVAISEVFIDRTWDGTYVVSQFTAWGLTSDDPRCA